MFEYFLTTTNSTNALFRGNFQKSLNSPWLKISLSPLTKIKNRFL
jgi:hypothetical protein